MATVGADRRGRGAWPSGWRDVPHDPRSAARARWRSCPGWPSCSWRPPAAAESGLALDRRAFCLRKRAEHEAGLYFASLSSRTIVYKGMLTTAPARAVLPGPVRPRRTPRALAMVHSRFSTNTFPSWPLAHPYRFIAHNGEINTVQGNRNWMRAREAHAGHRPDPAAADGGLERLLPILHADASDSASFDEVPRAAAPGRPLAAARHPR